MTQTTASYAPRRAAHAPFVAALAAAVFASGCGSTQDSAVPGASDTMSAAMSDTVAGMAATTPDADMQLVLDAHGALQPSPIPTLTPEEARQQPTPADAVNRVLREMGRDTTPAALVPGVTTADRTIPGAAGPMPTTVYTPAGAGPFPVIVYYHGGGWVIADRTVYDGGARGLAAAANAVVVSIDYRLAPEHKFPAQHDDALAAYRYVIQNTAEFNGDSSRVALAGESAGGNLAVATAVAARDAGLTMPVAVLSVYPIAQSDTTTESYTQYASAKPLDRATMGWFARHVSRTPADLQDPRISLVRANLQGLPPVTIINAEIDPLRTDGEMLERALREANVAVERRNYGGVTHEFFGMAAVVAKAREAQEYAGQRLRAAFGG